MFRGVIPRRMGMRRIAGIINSSLCLPNIGSLYELNLPLDKAILMPESKDFQKYRKYLRITDIRKVLKTLGSLLRIEELRQYCRY
jgi:hypothetical protein